MNEWIILVFIFKIIIFNFSLTIYSLETFNLLISTLHFILQERIILLPLFPWFYFQDISHLFGLYHSIVFRFYLYSPVLFFTILVFPCLPHPSTNSPSTPTHNRFIVLTSLSKSEEDKTPSSEWLLCNHSCWSWLCFPLKNYREILNM